MEPGGRPPAERASSGMPLPGPGTYSHTTNNVGGGYLGDAPMYTMGARKILAKPDDASPGPVYSPRMITPHASGPIGDAPEFSFGSSKRFSSADTGDPGPGKYDQLSTRVGGSMLGDAPKYGFGTAVQRVAPDPKKSGRYISKEHANKSNYALHSPGPLMYHLGSEIGQERSGSGGPNSPRYTMRPRLMGTSALATGGGGVDQPGPGTYNSANAFGAQVRPRATQPPRRPPSVTPHPLHLSPLQTYMRPRATRPPRRPPRGDAWPAASPWRTSSSHQPVLPLPRGVAGALGARLGGLLLLRHLCAPPPGDAPQEDGLHWQGL